MTLRAPLRPLPGLPLLVLLAALVAGAGCAAPAPPKPPTPQIPDAVTDLRVHQSGMAALLHFTLPRQSTDGTTLSGQRRVEIFREFAAAPTSVAPAPPESKQAGETPPPPGRPAHSLDEKELYGYLTGDTVTFPDTLTQGEFQTQLGKKVIYRVRTAAGGGNWSALSRPASVIIVEPPEPVRDLQATVSAGAVTLRWSPPAPGAALTPGNYAIYRTPLAGNGNAARAGEAVGMTTGTSYRDTLAEAGHRYRYTVRGILPVPGGEVESADSSPVVVSVPAPAVPAPPTSVAAIPVRHPSGSLEVDLSWAITGEPNLAGYNVYRSERQGERGVRLNRRPLASATFRDTTVAAGRVYYYSVTSVDPAGKESAPSAPVAVTVPQGAGDH